MKQNASATLFVLVLLLLLCNATAQGGPFDNLTPISTDLPVGLTSVAYGNGIFVAVGTVGPSSGWLRYSWDAERWTAAACQDQLCTPRELLDVTFADGRFVAAGNFGWTYSSTNGTNWLLDVVPSSDSFLWNVSYGDGKFVTVGDIDSCPCGMVANSANGVNWTPVFLDEILYLRGVAYGNGRWIAVGLSDFGQGYTARNIFNSTNLFMNWQATTTSETNDLFAIAYGNGLFVAAGHEHYSGTGRIITSTNGLNWAIVNLPVTNALRSVSLIQGLLVATGVSGALLTSTNGLQWRSRSSFTTAALARSVLGDNAILTITSVGALLKSDPLLSLRISLTPQPQLTIDGVEGRLCRIESSSNPASSSWDNRTTLRLEDVPSLWKDTLTPFGTARFYRATLLP